jgi:energy-coupling factor transporter ATP-binding protein EcfA2
LKLTFQKTFRSITGDVSAEELNDFVVISGPNGSGKSQLLEAIANGSIQVDDITQVNSDTIRLFALSQLVVPGEGARATNSLTSSWVSFKNLVEQVSTNIRNEHEHNPLGTEAFAEELAGRLVNGNGVLTESGLRDLIARVGKPLHEFSELDFQRHAPLMYLRRDPFQQSITELFLSYKNRLTLNQFQQWLQEKNGPLDVTPLSDEEFADKFGTPPWDLLDSILSLIGLDYAFNPPTGVAEHENYTATLRHTTLGTEVPTESLSSGEKTLLALAMSLYTGSYLGDSTQLPKILLLDEADASLHPEMVQSLLRVARETFVAEHSVKVMLTTHSPTTVALAPEESLYVMRRTPDPRLMKATDRDEALKSLTVGLSTLSVRTDARRTVFVESENDETAYQELLRIVAPRIRSEFSLDFLASGRGGKGDCEAVKHLVGRLRSAGNGNVFGIIDRDSRQGAPEGILFNAERYAIENVVYDPFIMGAFLLRENIVSAESLGLDPSLRHFGLGAAHSQSVIDSIAGSVDLGGDGQSVAVGYTGGFVAQVPEAWLTIRGHDLEDKILDAYPPLKAKRRTLLSEVIEKGYGDLPDLIPGSVLKLFENLLGSAA